MVKCSCSWTFIRGGQVHGVDSEIYYQDRQGSTAVDEDYERRHPQRSSLAPWLIIQLIHRAFCLLVARGESSPRLQFYHLINGGVSFGWLDSWRGGGEITRIINQLGWINRSKWEWSQFEFWMRTARGWKFPSSSPSPAILFLNTFGNGIGRLC